MSTEIEEFPFARPAVAAWLVANQARLSGPVVYLLDNAQWGAAKQTGDIYIGETNDLGPRLASHLAEPGKQHLRTGHIILNDDFNTSVCINLQAYLIRMLAGDGSWRVLNRNTQVTEFTYPQRDEYRSSFRAILDQLASKGMFTRSRTHIEISNLYKLSPFKALTNDQAESVVDITRQILAAVSVDDETTFVLQGDPGTGKTVVAIFLSKLLADIRDFASLNDIDDDSIFHEFFTPRNKSLLQRLRVALIVPQQSLRKSIQDVFRMTPGLEKDMVMTAFQLGKETGQYDIVIVDETHRLNQRASQPSAVLNADFRNINIRLFDNDDTSKTQLDWIMAKSRHRLLLVDTAQGVLPADLPQEVLDNLIDRALHAGRHFELTSQMRVEAGSDFIGYIREILNPAITGRRQHIRQEFVGYDFRLFDNFRDMDKEIFIRNRSDGLSRLVAGYAFGWKSKMDAAAFDIEIDGIQMQWNKSVVDWVSSSSSHEEVGSVHTIQGYDLNYVGVIIGLDLRYSLARQRLLFDRSSYHDARGKANNRMLGKEYSDQDLLRLITQIYAILLTRGIKGTYVYVCDRELREYLKAYIPVHQPG